ncbi:MAG TPA: Trp biosynthesis-associated membrane protein [Candidatus Stackebrandtia faecavium]|nr:Trp biosynthesis-associated membrane protein [Candidatus Stackebrandtia faecavium]
MTKNGRTMAACVLAGLASAGLGLYAVTRQWRAAGGTRLHSDTAGVTGVELASWSLGSLLVSFAAILALMATRGVFRRCVAVLIALGGLGVAGAGIRGCVTDFGVWPAITVVVAVIVLGVGIQAFRYAKVWPAMSSRYDRTDAKDVPQGVDADDPNALWDALDRGEDPTKRS